MKRINKEKIYLCYHGNKGKIDNNRYGITAQDIK